MWVFGPGDTRMCHNIPITVDGLLEPLEEDFFINLLFLGGTPPRVTLDPDEATVIILDNDSMCAV